MWADGEVSLNLSRRTYVKVCWRVGIRSHMGRSGLSSWFRGWVYRGRPSLIISRNGDYILSFRLLRIWYSPLNPGSDLDILVSCFWIRFGYCGVGNRQNRYCHFSRTRRHGMYSHDNQFQCCNDQSCQRQWFCIIPPSSKLTIGNFNRSNHRQCSWTVPFTSLNKNVPHVFPCLLPSRSWIRRCRTTLCLSLQTTRLRLIRTFHRRPAHPILLP